jgi:hypothetical protein
MMQIMTFSLFILSTGILLVGIALIIDVTKKNKY